MTPFRARCNRIDAQIRQMIAEGASDAKIGEAVGLTRFAIGQRRKRLGLDSAVMSQAALRRQTVAKRHAAGLSDREIALCVGVHVSTVMHIRRKLALDPNKPFLPTGAPPAVVKARIAGSKRRDRGNVEAKKPAPKPAPAPLPPAKPDLRAKVRPICAALGNVYDKTPDADVQQAIAAAMRAVHSDPAFARAWAEARNA